MQKEPTCDSEFTVNFMNLHLGLQSRFVFKAYESSTRPSALTAIIASIFLSFEAGCQSHNPPKLAPKAPPPPVAEVPPEALGRTIVAPPGEAPPPPMQIEVDLKALTPRTFVGLQQSGAPQPIWTLNHYLALGLPVIVQRRLGFEVGAN